MQWLRYGWDGRRTLVVASLFVAGAAIVWRIWPSATTLDRRSGDVAIAIPQWEAEAFPEDWKSRPSDNLFEGALIPFRDGGPVPHTGKFEYLVQYLSRQDPEAFAATILAETHAAGKHLDYETAMRDPERFRGQPVRVFGPLHYVDVAKVEITPGSFRNIWRGFLTDPSGLEAFVFESTEPLPEGIKHDDNELVEVEGLFLNIFRYESAATEEETSTEGVKVQKAVWREAPFVLARTVKRVDPKTIQRSPPDLGRGGGAMILFVPMLLVPLAAYVVIRVLMVRKTVAKAIGPLGRRSPAMPRTPRQ
ncbi:MAG: hypothetical protein U1E76_26280 [Planctomycetota bacterium]